LALLIPGLNFSPGSSVSLPVNLSADLSAEAVISAGGNGMEAEARFPGRRRVSTHC